MNLRAQCAEKVALVVTCALLLMAPPGSRANELKQSTLEAWDAYLQEANAQMQERVHGSFLWVDEAPDRLQSVRAGTILVTPVGPHVPKSVPSGLIHHWMGAAFIPGVRLEQVLAVLRDYNHYQQFFKPTVVESKSLGTVGDCDQYSAILVNKEAVAATALDSQYETCYQHLDELRWYSIAHSTSVRELRHYGHPDVQELPPDQGNGYIWRLYGFARFQERDGGVYVEVEGIGLSRDIPFAFRWVVNPMVRRISRNSMSIFLRQLQDAVRPPAVATK